ncbi:MAG TPA: hypothetical protein VJK26_01295 [Patescibacteria group bacterium]|nr:hypothetical protein [Patescibacteria group bacterium]
MNWQAWLITWLPYGLTLLILFWLFTLTLRDGLTLRTAKISLALILGITMLTIGAKMTYLYLRLRGDQFSQYLIPAYGENYYLRILWDLSQPLLWSLLIGLGLVVVFLILRRILKSPLVDTTDFLVVMLAIIAVGPTNVLVLILGGFGLMLLWQIFKIFSGQKISRLERLQITPFVLVVAMAVMVLSNFPFYFKFLNLLRLI